MPGVLSNPRVKDDLRRQFGTMWRMASTGFETFREVVVRSSQTGRLRVDLALLKRERQQLLAELGLKVARLIEDEELEVPQAVRLVWERLHDVESRIKADSVKVHDNAFGAARGYEPEAYVSDVLDDEDELDEHAEVAAPKGETR
jgi:hypothetical protein